MCKPYAKLKHFILILLKLSHTAERNHTARDSHISKRKPNQEEAGFSKTLEAQISSKS